MGEKGGLIKEERGAISRTGGGNQNEGASQLLGFAARTRVK